MIASLGDPRNPSVSSLVAYLGQGDLSPTSDARETIARSRKLERALLDSPETALPLIEEAIGLALRSDELMPERISLYELSGKFQAGDRKAIREAAISDMVKFNSVMLAKPSTGGLSEDSVNFADAAQIALPMTAAKAFFNSTGDEPEAVLEELRPALSGTLSPDLRLVYDAEFRRRFPSYRSPSE